MHVKVLYCQGSLWSFFFALLENGPKVPAVVATDTNATHQYWLQKQLVPLASGDQRYGVWYRIKTLPGTKTPV